LRLFWVISLLGSLVESRVHAADTFSPTGSMNVARSEHTGTLLNNGLVLVTGGANTNGPLPTNDLNSAELYTPATGVWRFAHFNMLTARRSHSATLLPGGKVLVAGGAIDLSLGVAPSLASAEIFDPATEQFVATGSMAVARVQHRAVQLSDGRVLVIGGRGPDGNNPINGCEIYDPVFGGWSGAASLPVSLIAHRAFRLPDGRVIVIGGYDGSSARAGVYAYSPSLDAWQTLTPLTIPRADATAVLLHNGKILVAGGTNLSSSLNSTEIYDPSAPGGHTTLSSPLAQEREAQSSAVLSSGQVLVVGGFSRNTSTCLASAEIFDPAIGLWTSGGTVAITRCATHSEIELSVGQVLIAGGAVTLTAGPPTATAELWAAQLAPRVYVANEGSNSISVIDPLANAVVATIPVGNHPIDIVVSPDGATVYVANAGGNSVSIISAASNTVVKTVTVGSNPVNVSIDPSVGTVYVANAGSNSVSVISTPGYAR
jgi:YVTN family beta-propeller protein